MIIRRKIEPVLLSALERFPILTLTGPRQSGKTTLCRKLFKRFAYANFEDSAVREIAAAAPKEFLKQFPRGAVIDEVQRLPEIFSAAQVLVDEDRSRKFIFTGSNNFSLLKNVAQSLAGRTILFKLLPLSLEELGEKRRAASKEELIFKGGYPAIWGERGVPAEVYSAYAETYLERDARELVNVRDLSAYKNFLKLCAGSVGQEFNAQSFASEVGVSYQTIQAWFSTLEAAYIAFRLPPFFRNIKKRIVKTPKIYFYDTGLAANLIGIENAAQLQTHPLRGALFENLVVGEFLKRKFAAGKNPSLCFYRDNLQKEVDLIDDAAGTLAAYEIKSASTFHKDFFKNLDYFRKLFGDVVVKTQLIYDGEIALPAVQNGIVNFRDL